MNSRQQAAGSRQRAVGRATRLNPEIPPCSSVPSVVKRTASVSPCLRGKKTSHGLTLVELLVVVTIMMILVGFALPRLRPASDQRRLREAARMTNVFLNRARANAIETGRPCGVRFEPIDNPVNDSTAASNTLYLVEVPPPYSGDVTGAVVQVQDFTVDPNWNGTSGSSKLLDENQGVYSPGHVVLKVKIRAGDFSDGLIRHGDPIQIGHKGPWYEIWQDPYAGGEGSVGGMPFRTDDDGHLVFSEAQDLDGDGWIDTNWLTLRVKAPSSQSPWPKWEGAYWSGQTYGEFSSPISFTIQRQPSPTIAQPLKLPRGTVVDLSASGLNQLDVQFIPLGNKWKVYYSNLRDFDGGVTIMFSPNGSVERCYYTDSEDVPQHPMPAEPLYFLIGREIQVGNGFADSPDTDPDEAKANWQLLDNYWVVISPQAGLVSVSENATTPLWNAVNVDKGKCIDVGINEARKFAKQSRSMGGR